jgi:hypothetical protein
MAQAMIKSVTPELLAPGSETPSVCPQAVDAKDQIRSLQSGSGRGKLARRRKQEDSDMKATQERAHRESKRIRGKAREAVAKRRQALINYTALGHLRRLSQHLGPDGSWATPLDSECRDWLKSRFCRYEAPSSIPCGKNVSRNWHQTLSLIL